MLLGQTQLGLDIDGEAAGDNSGVSVAVSMDGSRVAVGAPGNDGTGTNAGHTRIYEAKDGAWTKIGLDIDGEAEGDWSGSSVSLSADGRRVAIGAPNNDGSGIRTGHVRIFEETDGSWIQVGSDIDGEAGGDQLGYSISLSADGRRIAIGAPGNHNENGLYAGQVRIFEETEGNWVQLGTDIDGEGEFNSSGFSVSLSADGNRVAIGAPYNEDNGLYSGHVRVYALASSTWIQIGEDLDGESAGHHFGYSVSLSEDGRRLAIGGPRDSDYGPAYGDARVYEEVEGTWMLVDRILMGENEGDRFGYAVSLSADGRRVAIGAIHNSDGGTDAGHVRVFWERRGNGTWFQMGSDIDGEAPEDQSGFFVSISSDGNRVTISSIRNEGSGPSAGHVRVYDLQALTIIPGPPQVGNDIDGGTEYEHFGNCVSISANGDRLAIAAAANRGFARIYQRIDDNWIQIGEDIHRDFGRNISGEPFARSISLSADGGLVAISDRYYGEGVQVYKYENESWTRIGEDTLLSPWPINNSQSNSYISLSADGNWVAIGGVNDITGVVVKVYQIFANALKQVGNNITGNKEMDFGHSVSLSADGSRIAIGAPADDIEPPGQVKIFEYDAFLDTFMQIGQTLNGTGEYAHYGHSVSLSAEGNRVAIGVPYATITIDDSLEHVQIYEESGGIWSQVGTDIIGEQVNDNFGSSVSLSEDGNRLAIGAPGNDGVGPGAGHVRIYDLIGTSWIQYDIDIDGETSFDGSGTSVSLSADGWQVAIGAPNNSNFQSNAGHVRVYDISSEAVFPIELLTFTGTVKEWSVLLVWHTSMETNNAYFALEHSVNGKTWNEVGRVKSYGNSQTKQSYQFEHQFPVLGVNYYRLKQTDFDGTFARSGVVSVIIEQFPNPVMISPNPTPPAVVSLSLSKGISASTIRLLTSSGQLLRTFPGNTSKIDLAGLPAASYLLQVDTSDGVFQNWVVVQY